MAFRTKLTTLATVVALGLPTGVLADGHVNAETVVATVNGQEITLGHMIVLRQRLPQQYQQLPGDVLFDGIIDQLVQQTLLSEQVEELSLGTRLTMENEIRALRANEEIVRAVADAESEEALQAAYTTAYGSVDPEPEYNASHILVETEDEAKDLVTALNDGADFAELAQEKSTGPSGPRGGELGWFGAGAMVAEFEEVVMTLDVGAISGPIQTQFGWHVIKLNETRVKDAPPLEDVRGELVDTIQREAVEAYVAKLTEGADITRKTVSEIDPELLNDLSLLGE
ncbi:peptidylprolyl isomerase [Rhodobacteraceae bacterium]|nr:peptidylprolyl isomerase [Paracoccaceae bacterium]